MATLGPNADAIGKVLLPSEPRSDANAPLRTVGNGGDRLPSISFDPDTVQDGLVRLVLCLVDTLRQLLERQAIRRVESDHLSEDEIERLGLTLLRLEERMDELKAFFGLKDEDLTLKLGTIQDLS